MNGARIPLATYRLQFNRDFTFRDAHSIVDYLNALGITDCYASSYLKAVPGSPHGYDVADPTCLNPDLGTDVDYWTWIDALRARGMGHVLDLVPNHMGIADSANPWWQDVLENGPSSRFARFFDIEWHPVKAELANRVLIPTLGDQYGAVLERQELHVIFRDGAFAVEYGADAIFPLAPDTYPAILGLDLEALTSRASGAESDELQSIMTAALNLPPRSTGDAQDIVTRAREKEIVKRRLAALASSSGTVRDYLAGMVRHFNGTPGQPRSFDLLDRLLNEQSYRLAHWRVASEEINYRRFFDVNQLAALRMEDPVVFEEVHRFVFELIRRGGASGLRVDHVDGLFAPADYLSRLQSRAAGATAGHDRPAPGGPPDTPVMPRPFYIVVEKILATGEQLPAEWAVHGTTGYEFAAAVNRLFVDGRNERALSDLYLRFIRERRERLSFKELAYRSQKQVLHQTMSGDINSLGHQLNRFSERNRHFRDFTLYSLISTLKEIIACFPVYRTYVIGDRPVSGDDRRFITEAVRNAKRRAPALTTLVFDFIQNLLLQETPIATPEECEERGRFIGKFQQITSPVSAKGIEDTALYLYNRLLSLNEVGSDPTRFGADPAVLHAWLAERQASWPAALSALSTHDSKRGEDARARINVLSEIPGGWKAAVTTWRTWNRRHRTERQGDFIPDRNEEYLIYQTLVGSWPFDAAEQQSEGYRRRIQDFLIKALREGKVHTSWLVPNEEYEAGVLRFVESILDQRRSPLFLPSFTALVGRVAELGIYNSLAQTLIKITAPGVPDFYQGTELWDLTLVDPDNRRPVDYEARRAMIERLDAGGGSASRPDPGSGADQSEADGRRDADWRPTAAGLLASRTDGRIKLFVIRQALAARARWRDLYEQGEYVALPTTGARRDCLFAFARRHRRQVVITCVPRMVASLLPDAGAPPIGRAVWADTAIEVPGDRRSGRPPMFADALTGATMTAAERDGRLVVPAAMALEHFPVALLAAI
ncbi:MAG: malto-oligosyltrehalose synthase [Acidobacteriota bacterium]